MQSNNKKFRIRVLILVLLFLLKPVITNSQINFIDYFELHECIQESYMYDSAFKVMIPDKMAYKYLCPIKNECFNNPSNGNTLTYYPLSKINYNSYWILVYCVTDGYSINTYISSFSTQNDYILATLHIYRLTGGDTVLTYLPKDRNRIEIIREMEFDDVVKTFHETYELNISLSPIQVKKRQEFPLMPLIIEPTPVLDKPR